MNSVCRVVRAGEAEATPQGAAYAYGISAESVGARGLGMHLGTIAPGARARAHLHEHETAIYLVSGHVGMDFGDALAERLEAEPGDLVHIPGGTPHRPYNLSEAEPATRAVARTDAHADEPTTLLE